MNPFDISINFFIIPIKFKINGQSYPRRQSDIRRPKRLGELEETLFPTKGGR
jgi:hypothetical protein